MLRDFGGSAERREHTLLVRDVQALICITEAADSWEDERSDSPHDTSRLVMRAVGRRSPFGKEATDGARIFRELLELHAQTLREDGCDLQVELAEESRLPVSNK